MTSQASSTLPAPAYSGNTTSCQAKGAPACADELVDIVHITGENEKFYALTEKESKELKAEIQRVQNLMDELHQIVAQATHKACKKSTVSNQACDCSYCKKEEWAKKAEGAGLLTLNTIKAQEKSLPLESEDYPGQRQELIAAKDFYEKYDQLGAVFKGDYGNLLSQNWQILKEKKLAEINIKLTEIGSKAASGKTKEDEKDPEEVETMGNDAKPNGKYSSGIEHSSTSTTKVGIIEILVFSQPDKRYYISRAFILKVKWRESSSSALRNRAFSKELAKNLIKDIKDNIKEKTKDSSFGEVEKKITIWKSKEDNLLNALHQEIGKAETDTSDSSRYAVSAEAHMLRFAAAASAKIQSFNPASGNVDLGGKFEAAFALAEGKISLEEYFPQKSGRKIYIQYKNSLGKDVRQSFGSLRLKGGLELSCFAGVKGSVEAELKLKVPIKFNKPETGSGVYALLGRPSIKIIGGSAKLSCEAFAGAQAGGKLSGCIEWLEPAPKADSSGKKEPAPDWETLVELKGEAYAAYGIGAGAEFNIQLNNNKFVLYTKASAVFGPGAGGGVGTEVALDKIFSLLSFICNTLAEIDYRVLVNIAPEAFEYAARILYKAALYPRNAIQQVVMDSYEEFALWWSDRKDLKHEAELLTNHILKDNCVVLGEKKLSFTLLPPETLGQMLWLLSETFVGEFSLAKEKAIIVLIRHIRRWRHFIEVLEHMTRDGSKGPKAIQSLDRLNSFLLADQKNQLNIFMETLVLNGDATTPAVVEPWNIRESWDYIETKRRLVASIRNGDDYRYIA
ncbi:hypothetical protein JQR88_23620 (plasmid) [Pseudomonas luteola]|uniref:hypothetical protein n=1 Tax=Pseudomonas luteola TaxID=47886 RepID=UPI003DA11117